MPALTPTRTLPALPGPYQTALLNPLDTPHTYIQDTCQYLHDKWSSANSAPGTVVMVIMFHIITNAAITNPNQISEYNFRQLMKASTRMASRQLPPCNWPDSWNTTPKSLNVLSCL